MIKVTVTRINARSSARPPRSVVVRVPGPQGPAGTANLGTVTVVNPDQNPNVMATGTARDRIYNFVLPRAAAFAVGDVVAGDDATDVAVTDVGTNGDVELDFRIPRTTVNVGATTTVNPDVNPSVGNSGTDAAAVFDFDLPRAADFSVDPVNVVNPDQSPSVILNETDGDYDIEFSLPRAPGFTVGNVTVGADATDADVADVGTDGDIELDFKLPRATLDVGTTTSVNPDQSPAVTNSGTDASAVFDFSLPRAPTFTVGDVTTTLPGTDAVITNVGSDGDIVLDIEIPRGDTGDPGPGLPPSTVEDVDKIIFVTEAGGTEYRLPVIDDLDDADTTVKSDGDLLRYDSTAGTWGPDTLNTDDIAEGTNLFYTDSRADARAILFAIALGG